ncbi:MAG: rhodanese-like domain-containing protein [Actinomycetota bacterium]|nr:rhodanese-like domain-containing protein [Actinomycetota bacterium]
MNLQDVKSRLGEEGFVLLDVRSAREFTGEVAAPCDPRPGRIPGARHFDLQELLGFTPEQIRGRLGPPEASDIVTYCHSGSRSELAAQILTSLGYRAANYHGSWHEWSRDESLPAETG